MSTLFLRQLHRCQEVPLRFNPPQHHPQADIRPVWCGSHCDFIHRPKGSKSILSRARRCIRSDELLCGLGRRQSAAALHSDRTPKAVTYCSQHFSAGVSNRCAKQCAATGRQKAPRKTYSALLECCTGTFHPSTSSGQNSSPAFTSPGPSNIGLSPARQRKVLVFRPLAKSTADDTVTLEKAPPEIPLKQAPVPTFEDFVAAGTDKGVNLTLNTVGPVFWIEAKAAVDGVGGPAGKLLGKVDGFVLLWPGGSILHLDTMRVAREVRLILDLSLIMGGAMLRHGYDRGCKRAELLAINDTDVFHRKLVNYYKRIGFTAVHEVTGGLSDIPHMLVWGGLGTRMDADIETILRKWSKRFARGSSERIGHREEDRTKERTQ